MAQVDDITDEYEKARLARIATATPNAIPSTPTIDRTVDQTFAARGLPTPATAVAPTSTIGQLPTPDQQQQLGIGRFIDRFGDTLGSTQDLSGAPQSSSGAVGVQGTVSPQEQAFWAAHPNGIGVPSNYSGTGAPPPGTPGVDSRVFNPRTGNWEGSFPPPVGGTSGRLVPPEVFGGLSQPNQPATNPDYGQQINDYYTQKRAEIQQAKAPLMVHLGMADPSTIGASGTTLLSKQGGRHGQPSEYERGLMQLRNLNAQENQILSEHHAAVTENAKTQHENLVRQAHIDAANGITKLSTGLNYVNQTYQKGDPKYTAAIMELLQDPQIAKAVTTRGGESILAPHLKSHQDVTDTMNRLQAAGYIKPGTTATATAITASGAPHLKLTPPGGDTADLEKQLKASYGVTKDNILNPATMRTGKMDVGADGSKQFSNQHSAPEHNAVELTTGKGKQVVVMPIDAYNRYATAFGGQPASTTPAAQPTSGLQIKSEQEYGQLPSGSLYVDPNGVKRRKP